MTKYRLYKGLLLVSFPTLVWGVGAVLISELIDSFADFRSVLALRFLLSAILFVVLGLTPVLAVRYRGLLRLAARPFMLLVGFVYLPLTLFLIFWSIDIAGPGLTALIWNLYPLFGIVAGRLVFNDRLLKSEQVGNLILVLISIAWSVVRYNIVGSFIGVLVALSSVASYIAGLVLVRKTVKQDRLNEFNLLSILIGAVTGGVYLYVVHPQMLSIRYLGSVALDWRFLYLILGMTVLANLFYSKAMYYLELSEVTMFTYIQSVITILTEASVYNMPIKLTDIILILLLVIGFIISLYGIRQEFKQYNDA